MSQKPWTRIGSSITLLICLLFSYQHCGGSSDGGGSSSNNNGNIIALIPSSIIVVFLQDSDTGAHGGTGIYRVDAVGGTPIRLDHVTAANHRIYDFALSPDKKYVVYTADTGPGTSIEVWSVLADGSAASVKLSVSPAPAYWMAAEKFLISPNSQTVIYRADQDTDNKYELYNAPIDGSAAAVKISGTITNANGDVPSSGFHITPDGNRVVFRADADVDSVDEMFSVPIGGGSRIKLHANLSAGEDVFAPVISPNSQRVVYVARKGGVLATYSAAVAATGDIKLNNNSGGVLISGDSTRVIYVDDQLVGGRYEVFSVSITGGGTIRISGTKVAGASAFPSFQLAGDGTTVVYTNDEDVAGQNQLYAANYTTPSAPLTLSGIAQGATSDVTAFKFSGDGNTVVYRGDQDVDNQFEIYKNSLTSITPTKVNGPMVASGDVNFNVVTNPISNDGSIVVYYADQETNNLNEIYANNSGSITKVSPSVIIGDSLSKVTLTEDAKRVIYQYFDSTASTVALYSVKVDGTERTQLSGTLTNVGTILKYFEFEP